MKPLSAASRRSACRGKVAPKKKVLTLVERGGRARSFHITHLDHTNIRAAMVTNVAPFVHAHDGRCPLLRRIGREFASHETTLHGNREFSRGDGSIRNTAENFFSAS